MTTLAEPPDPIPTANEMMYQFAKWVAQIHRAKITFTVEESAGGYVKAEIDRRWPNLRIREKPE